jgi:hypothetical protein
MPVRSWIRTAVLSCVLLAGLAGVPASGLAASAPSLSTPAADADPVTEGGSLTLAWRGDLQGDASALDRSFFRVELIAAAEMPPGAQSEWPEAKLANFALTEPGSAVHEASVGVPPSGDYRWRVCAWGVVDVMAANEIQQLPGGCSASRALKTVAAASTAGAIGKLDMEERHQVKGRVTTVYVPRDDAPTVTEPVQDPQPAAPVADPEPPATFQPVGTTDRRAGKGSSLGLGGGSDIESLDADDAASRDGIAGAVLGGLGSNLPLVPIPFWTLALLLACVPILVAWRRSVLGMFDWADGSVDGLGTMSDPLGELAYVPVAKDVKIASMTADGMAPAPHSLGTDDAPEGRRRAA